jgi:hypothetical protein
MSRRSFASSPFLDLHPKRELGCTRPLSLQLDAVILSQPISALATPTSQLVPRSHPAIAVVSFAVSSCCVSLRPRFWHPFALPLLRRAFGAALLLFVSAAYSRCLSYSWMFRSSGAPRSRAFTGWHPQYFLSFLSDACVHRCLQASSRLTARNAGSLDLHAPHRNLLATEGPHHARPKLYIERRGQSA